MTGLRVELDRREREALRDLWSAPVTHAPTLELVEARAGGGGPAVLQRVEPRSGPARGELESPVVGALAVEPGVHGADAAGVELPPVHALDVLDARLRRLRLSTRRLYDDGVYALALRADSGPALLALRLRDGRPERLTGGAELGWDGAPSGLVTLLRLRAGRPRLVLDGEPEALRALMRSARPATALEHASIRGDVEALYLSRRLSLGLLALRLLGL